MCGIVGVAGTITRQEEKVFRGLLEVDTARGPHSTGVLNVRRNESLHPRCIVDKSLGTPWDLYRKVNGSTKLFAPASRCFIGHNRSATIGAINEDNAHPLHFSPIYGVHNGTMVDWKGLDGAKQFDLDSKAIYNHLSQHGISDTTKNMRGAYTLVWYNEEENTINMVRNSQRPLFFTFSEDGKALFWASEQWMLESQLNRFGVKHRKILKLSELVHCKLTIPESNKEFDNPRTKRVEEKPAPARKYTGGKRNPFHGGRGFPYDDNEYDDVFHGRTPNHVRNHGALPAKASQNTRQKLDTFLGADVLVKFDRKISRGSQAQFLAGYLLNNSEVSVRLYQPPKEVEDSWGNGRIFQGRVKRINAKEGYLLLDRRTTSPKWESRLRENIKSVKKQTSNHVDNASKSQKIPTYYPVCGNVLVPESTFYEYTEKGCAFCADPPSLQDAEKLYWLDNDEFICESCQALDEAKEYMAIQ